MLGHSPANLLLQDTVERIHVGKQFGDIPRGIYLVRGENVALCGEIVSVNSANILPAAILKFSGISIIIMSYSVSKLILLCLPKTSCLGYTRSSAKLLIYSSDFMLVQGLA